MIYAEDPIQKVLALKLAPARKFEALFALKRAGVRATVETPSAAEGGAASDVVDLCVSLVFGLGSMDPTDATVWDDVGPIGAGGHSVVRLARHRPTGVEFVVKGPIPATFGEGQLGTPPEILAKNECLAAELYLAFGVVMPLTRYGLDAKGEWYVLSQKYRDIGGRRIDQVLNISAVSTPFFRPAWLFEGFVADCMLCNYDVVGSDCDNLYITEEGFTIRIDPGGALFYKSMGSKKLPEQFGKVPDVAKQETELYQLRSYRSASTEHGDEGYAQYPMRNLRRVFGKFPENEDAILTYGAERCCSAQCEGALEELCSAFYAGHATLERDREVLHRVLAYRLNWLRRTYLADKPHPTFVELRDLHESGVLKLGIGTPPPVIEGDMVGTVQVDESEAVRSTLPPPRMPRRNPGPPRSSTPSGSGRPVTPYHVGKRRAKAQLRSALETRNDEARLRRLWQAFEVNDFDWKTNVDGGASKEVASAVTQFRELSHRLGGVPAAYS